MVSHSFQSFPDKSMTRSISLSILLSIGLIISVLVISPFGFNEILVIEFPIVPDSID